MFFFSLVFQQSRFRAHRRDQHPAMDPKEIQTTTVTDELAVEDDEKFGTVRDVQDMDRMGKLQQLRVTYTFESEGHCFAVVQLCRSSWLSIGELQWLTMFS